MSTITEQLKWLVTADASSAISAFEKTGDAAEKNLSKTDGKLDKLGGNLTKTGAGAMAFAGIAGVALFKAATAFEDLALEASKFSDATGVSVEDASRMMEVVGKLGIDIGAAEKSLGFMNKTLGQTPQKFADLGVEIVKAADGTTDVIGTFGNVIDVINEIPNAEDRAAAGAALLGKGWMSMAEVVKGGSVTFTEAMKAVGDAQVINEEEVEKAKAMRAALDDASDAVAQFVLGIGAGAAPAITTFVSGLASVLDKIGSVDAVSGGAIGTFTAFGVAAIGVGGALSFIAGQAIKMRTRLGSGEDAMSGLGKAATGATIGLAAVGAGIAALQVIDVLTEDAKAAEGAMNKFIATSGTMDVAKGDTVDLLNAWQDLSHTIQESEGASSQALDAFSSGFDSSEFKLANLTDAFDKVAAKSPAIAMQIVTALEAVDAAAKSGNEGAQDKLNNLGLTSDVIAGFKTQLVDAAAAQAVLNSSIEESPEDLAAQAEATRLAAQAQQEFASSVQDAVDALHAEAQEMQDQVDAARAAADSVFAVADANDAYNEHLATLKKTIKEAKGDQDLINAAYREGTDLAATHADAVVKLNDDTAKANGTTVSHADAMNTWNREMLYSATQALPAERDAMIDYIAQSNLIPPEKMTEVRALIDDGKFEEAAALLAELSATQTMSVVADADTQKADQELAIFLRNRTMTVDIETRGGAGYFKGPHGASGATNTSAGPWLVGENGPEIVEMPGGATIRSNADSRKAMTAISTGRSGALVHMEHVTITSGTDAAAVASAINLKLLGVS